MKVSNKERYMLDTSALLAFLEDEEGADLVERILRKSPIVPFISLLEIYYISLQENGEEMADMRYAKFRSLDAEFLWDIDEITLLRAAKFKARYRLPLADAIIASFAKTKKAVLVHKDPDFLKLENEVALLGLPYKKSM